MYFTTDENINEICPFFKLNTFRIIVDWFDRKKIYLIKKKDEI